MLDSGYSSSNVVVASWSLIAENSGWNNKNGVKVIFILLTKNVGRLRKPGFRLVSGSTLGNCI